MHCLILLHPMMSGKTSLRGKHLSLTTVINLLDKYFHVQTQINCLEKGELAVPKFNHRNNVSNTSLGRYKGSKFILSPKNTQTNKTENTTF